MKPEIKFLCSIVSLFWIRNLWEIYLQFRQKSFQDDFRTENTQQVSSPRVAHGQIFENDVSIKYLVISFCMLLSVRIDITSTLICFPFFIVMIWNVLENTTTVPEIFNGTVSDETFFQNRAPNLNETLYRIVSLFCFSVMETIIFLYLLAPLWKFVASKSKLLRFQNCEISISVVFAIILITLETLLNLPFQLVAVTTIYQQTILFHLGTVIKRYLLRMIKVFLYIPITVYIVRAKGRFFFIYLWLLMLVYDLLYTAVYVDVIVPQVEGYKLLENGELKTLIENLTSSINFPVSKVFFKQDSQDNGEFNAYYYGGIFNERIVISDLMAQALSNEEMTAVVAHELGHWEGNHYLKIGVFTEVYSFFLLALGAVLFEYDIMFRAFRFHDSKPIIVGLIIIFRYIIPPSDCIISLPTTSLSRYLESEADLFSVKLGQKEYLFTALIKTSVYSLSPLVGDGLHSMFTQDHSMLVQRLEKVLRS